MKERPILFSTAMIQAIQNCSKSQTRRVVKPQPHIDCGQIEVGLFYPTKIDRHGEEYPGDEIFGAYTLDGDWGCKCPYGQVGDRLWVRETWQSAYGKEIVLYKADYSANDLKAEQCDFGKWKPSIFMPRWASRITLEITNIRAERVQDISQEDAIAEGLYGRDYCPAPEVCVNPDTCSFDSIPHFIRLWDSINAKRGYSWESNPWVFPIEFKVVSR